MPTSRETRSIIDFEKGSITVANKEFNFAPLPGKLMDIIRMKGLVNWIKNK